MTVTATSGLMLPALGKSSFHACNCPCARHPGYSQPLYVHTDYYCDTATFNYGCSNCGIPLTPSGTGRTVTMGATAVLIRDNHGFGGHSNKRHVTTVTSQFDGVLIVDQSWIKILEQNCWKFTSTNSCSTNTHMYTSSILYTHIISLVHI